mgnify:CR=1 FL=1
MKYTIKTKHQDGSNYVCVKVDDIVPALNYAQEMTRGGDYPFPLIVETEGHDEICIVVNGCCYQVSDPEQIIKDERSGNEN